MKGQSQVVIEFIGSELHGRYLRRPSLVLPTSRGDGTGPNCDPVSNLVEPAAELALHPGRSGLPGENEKGSGPSSSPRKTTVGSA
jgi:hypothetical protein